MLNFSIKKIRIFLWSLLAGATLFFLWQGVVPTGEITYSATPGERNDFIGKLTPETRVKEKGKITGNPVYFSLRTPRNFQTAEVTLTYKNKDLALMETGLLADGRLWRYKTQPMENMVVDKWSQKWHTLSKEDLLLVQKDKQFSSVENFLNDPPPASRIATYNYELNEKFVLPDYSATTSAQVLNTDLLGDYQFFTYIKNEELNFDLTFRDRNRNKDKDPVDINLYFRDELVDSWHLEDDGVSRDTGNFSEPKSVKLRVPDLEEGVYKIEVKANDDIVTERIKTSQQKLSFLNKIRLADTVEGEQNIYTTGEEISAKVFDPAHLQTVPVKRGDKLDQLNINETYKRFSLNRDICSPCRLSPETGGISLFSNGVFSFDKGSLIDPSTTQVTPGFNPEKRGIKYILARYNPPEREGKYKKATAEFDLTRGYKENNKYKFMISVPGLKAEDGIKDSIKIKKIKVKLQGRSLWEKIANSK